MQQNTDSYFCKLLAEPYIVHIVRKNYFANNSIHRIWTHVIQSNSKWSAGNYDSVFHIRGNLLVRDNIKQANSLNFIIIVLGCLKILFQNPTKLVKWFYFMWCKYCYVYIQFSKKFPFPKVFERLTQDKGWGCWTVYTAVCQDATRRFLSSDDQTSSTLQPWPAQTALPPKNIYQIKTTAD